jgi:uncharacterized protein YkwD
LPGYSVEGRNAGLHAVIDFDNPYHCVAGFMASLYHRVPLLNPKLKKIGFAYVKRLHDEVFWVDVIDIGNGEE